LPKTDVEWLSVLMYKDGDLSEHAEMLFTEVQPTLENYWRSIILFGRNVASYKFALGKSRLELSPKGKEIITLDDLAVPFCSPTHLRCG